MVKALAHPIRAQVLGVLQDRVASPNELSRELGVSLGSVSYHVHRLVALGFLKLVKKTPRRGAIEHYYTAIARPRVTDEAWGEVPPIVKEAAVSAALDHLARHVNAAAGADGFNHPDAHLTRTPISVDAEGWKALSGELEAVTKRVRAIAAESAARLAEAEAEPGGEIAASVVLMLFETAPDRLPALPAPVAAHHATAREAAGTRS
ncbi:MAG: ArsR/SmtB family transcription factor [Solirubrobacteraceae bacterium]